MEPTRKFPLPFDDIRWKSGKAPPILASREPLPFEIGIATKLNDLAEPGQTAKLLIAIRKHTGSKPYVASMLVDGAMRYDVNGRPVGKVALEHQLFASALMAYKLSKAANEKPTKALTPRETAVTVAAALFEGTQK